VGIAEGVIVTKGVNVGSFVNVSVGKAVSAIVGTINGAVVEVGDKFIARFARQLVKRNRERMANTMMLL